MPIYEFRCEHCGWAFEELMGVGTKTVACPNCHAMQTRRVYSHHQAPFRLVKTPGEMRKQERRNALLRQRTARRLSEARRRSGRTSGGPA